MAYIFIYYYERKHILWPIEKSIEYKLTNIKKSNILKFLNDNMRARKHVLYRDNIWRNIEGLLKFWLPYGDIKNMSTFFLVKGFKGHLNLFLLFHSVRRIWILKREKKKKENIYLLGESSSGSESKIRYREQLCSWWAHRSEVLSGRWGIH